MKAANQNNNTRPSWLMPVLLLFVVLVFLRLPTLYQPIIDVDEAIYGLFARIWFDGGIPYIDCVETKPLGIYFFYGVIFSLFGKFNMIAVHAATIVVVGITSYILYLIAKSLYSSRAGFWAALLYIVFGTTYIPKVIATTIEPIMLLFVVLQFYFWLLYERRSKNIYAFVSGLVFSAACLFKYQALMNIFVLATYIGLIRPLTVKKIKYREHWKGFGFFIFGALPLPLIMIFYLLLKGAFEGFWFWNVRGNIEYISGGTHTLILARQIATRVLPYMASTALMWVLSVSRIWKMVRSIRTGEVRDATSPQEWLIVLWLFMSIIPVSAGYRFYGHYFLLLLPPMAILSSQVADRVWSSAGEHLSRWFVILSIIIPGLGFTAARFFTTEIHKAVHEDTLDDYKPLATYISEHTSPGEKIVAWGFAPPVYWYSERLPGTRFFWSDVLTGRVPGLNGNAHYDNEKFVMPETWEMFLGDLDKNKPIYIIDTTPANLHDYRNYPIERYRRLKDYINSRYREEISINGAIFYRRMD
jgi:4-amino-4-deoxy-L-arabinose transferase-like glycosyltransferase